MPEGVDTEFRAGWVVVPAIDLGLRYGEYQQYPYDSVDSLVEDLISGLKAEGVLPVAEASTPRTDTASSPEENLKS